MSRLLFAFLLRLSIETGLGRKMTAYDLGGYVVSHIVLEHFLSQIDASSMGRLASLGVILGCAPLLPLVEHYWPGVVAAHLLTR